MSLLNQKTIKEPVKFNGIGLHSGQNVNLCIVPSNPNTGIIFKRVDLKNNNLIYPNFDNVSNTSLNTTISNEFGIKVSTIEHLMGALFGLGIDNALVEIDSEEVPILDGSAKNFIEKIIIKTWRPHCKTVGDKSTVGPLKSNWLMALYCMSPGPKPVGRIKSRPARW